MSVAGAIAGNSVVIWSKYSIDAIFLTGTMTLFLAVHRLRATVFARTINCCFLMLVTP